MRRLRTALAAAALLCAPLTAGARPFTVDDLLHEGAFGATALDPSRRWLVIERHDAYDTAERYDFAFENGTALSRVLVEDLTHPGLAQPLIEGDRGRGDSVVAFSPSGRRLAITRLASNGWRLGVVDMASRRVRWFPISPDDNHFGRTLQWISDDVLLVVNRPDGSQPWYVRTGHVAADTLPARWRATASGVGAHTVMGSGAWAADRDRPPPTELLRLDVRSGQTRRLTTGENLDIEVSPDGRHLALLSAGADIQATASQPVQGDWGIETQRADLTLLDLQTGVTSHPCPRCDILPHVLTWSPDGGALLTFARREDQPWSEGQLYEIDPAGSAAVPIGLDLAPVVAGRPEIVRTGWMGADPLVFARPRGRPDQRPDWFRLPSHSAAVNLTSALPTTPRTFVALGAHHAVLAAAGRLWRIDEAGAARDMNLPEIDDERPQANTTSKRPDVIPPQAGWVFSRGPTGGRRPVSVSAEGAPQTLSVAVSGPIVAASNNPQAVVVSAKDQRGSEQLVLLRPDQAPSPIASVNSDLADLNAPDIREVDHTGPDGQPLKSWLFLPPHVPGALPPPLVIRAYSGDVYRKAPDDYPMPIGAVTNIALLVGHGYAVLTPSLPIPKAAQNEPMAGLAERILDIVDRAAADPVLGPTFDAKRLALWGHSWGAFTVQGAITQSQRFKAAVALSGSNDLISRWGAFSPPHELDLQDGVFSRWSAGSIEFLQGKMGVPPWEDPARYVRNSPLLSAGCITTPLMLVAGDQDIGQPAQPVLMFSALNRQAKDGLLVIYWGESHIISSPGNVRDLWSRAFEFLDRNLDGAPSADRARPSSCRESVPASAGPRPR